MGNLSHVLLGKLAVTVAWCQAHYNIIIIIFHTLVPTSGTISPKTLGNSATLSSLKSKLKTFMLAERRPNCQPPHSLHETTQRYCRCRALVVTFVYYEFGTLSCATKLAKVPHTFVQIIADWKCSPVISPGDICPLISWYLSFWGCKRH